MNLTALDRFFRPKTVAVIGGIEAERVAEQLDLLGYQGEVWPIHPTRTQMAGRSVITSLADLPRAVDVAFLAVPGPSNVELVRELSMLGVGGAVVYASGFGEIGNLDLEEALVEASGDMPIMGPNCYGYINALDGTAIWPDVHGLGPVARGVGIITQSGNIAINLTMSKRSLDIGMMITAGNQADLSIPLLIESLLDDPRITAIGLQLEAIEDTQAFARAAIRALEQEIPIVALKVGTSTTGTRVTKSHTGAIAGDDDAYSALFARYGVARATSIPSFLETLKLAGIVESEPRVVSLSASGGEAALVADLAEARGVRIPDIGPSHRDVVSSTVDRVVTISNPMDYHTVAWGDATALEETFTALINESFDIALLVLDFPTGEAPEAWWTACRAFASACNTVEGLIVATLPENLPPDAQAKIREYGLVPMLGLNETMEAIATLGSSSTGVVASPHTPGRRITETAHSLDESASKRLLSSAGIRIPIGEVLSNVSKTSISFPVTLKSLGIEHKMSAGAIAVGVGDAETLRNVAAAMPKGDGFLVEETVVDGIAELFVSLTAIDQFGWLLTIGLGGSGVEQRSDQSHLLTPVSSGPLRRAIERYVDPEETAMEELVDTVKRLQTLVGERTEIVEVEINPLLVRTAEVVALDALVTTQ